MNSVFDRRSSQQFCNKLQTRCAEELMLEGKMTCKICGGEGARLANTKNGFELLRCSSCALVFCSPMPAPKELEDYYQGFAYAMPNEQAFAKQVAYTEAGTRRAVAEIAGVSDLPIEKVLDFGGGLGFFANALSKHYSEVACFDLDQQSRDFARKRFGDRFVVFETAEEALSETYDLVLLNQVIEHVPEPGEFLSMFKPALKPGGLLVITTPNNAANDNMWRPDVMFHYARRLESMPKALSLMLKDSWLCCDPPRHLFAFNGSNLSTLAKNQDFTVKRVVTKYFDEDPYGQPKYYYQGFGGQKAAAASLLHLISKASASIARRLSHGEQGSTLIAYLGL